MQNRKRRRRPPSDEKLLRNATNPGIGRTVLIGAGMIAVLGVGLALVVSGLF